MCLEVAIWRRVGIRRVWRCGSSSGAFSGGEGEELAGGDDGDGALGKVRAMALEREERKVGRSVQIRTVVGWVCWVRMYSRSSEGRAGGRAIGVGDIVDIVSIIRVS